ncbi:gp376 [Bacillus phage G]|uniref:Gp376 n=1 Tax=Bacillus phage G TaxID=2884420 RepID=G3MAB7_9CAUD|nr:gp376 [Bacillus phage G]AEO93635.1 gp376 [Bacillus phage G]
MKEEDILNQPEKDFETILNEKSTASNASSSLKDLEGMIQDILSTLPNLNREKLRREMQRMTVKLEDNPTTSQLNEGLSHAQGYKDRLSEIYTYALREYKTRNRCMEMLFDAVNYVSNAKSADKRKGEATMLYPMLIIQREAAETFMKEVEHVLQNIKSAHDSISRQVSIAQIQVQLGEFRRGETNPQLRPSSQAEEFSANRKKNEEVGWEDF